MNLFLAFITWFGSEHNQLKICEMFSVNFSKRLIFYHLTINLFTFAINLIDCLILTLIHSLGISVFNTFLLPQMKISKIVNFEIFLSLVAELEIVSFTYEY